MSRPSLVRATSQVKTASSTDGRDDDDDLDVGELHDEAARAFMQGIAAGDDRRESA